MPKFHIHGWTLSSVFSPTRTNVVPVLLVLVLLALVLSLALALVALEELAVLAALVALAAAVVAVVGSTTTITILILLSAAVPLRPNSRTEGRGGITVWGDGTTECCHMSIKHCFIPGVGVLLSSSIARLLSCLYNFTKPQKKVLKQKDLSTLYSCILKFHSRNNLIILNYYLSISLGKNIHLNVKHPFKKHAHQVHLTRWRELFGRLIPVEKARWINSSTMDSDTTCARVEIS